MGSLTTRFVLVLVGSAVYLGLAILGWGGFEPFFSNPARVALAVVFAFLAVFAFFAGGNVSAGVREDRTNRWIIPAISLLGLLNGFLPAWTERHEFWTFGGDAVRWTGVALAAAGGALRIWPVVVLGNRFSGLVAIQAGHTLTTTGVYRVIRNPSYLGLLTGSLGWGLAFRSGVGVLITALLLPPLVARIRSEEGLLHAHFGAEYDAYRARTWRLIPGVY